jgi:toxin HigB-1
VIKFYKNAKTRRVHETGNPKGFKGLDGARAVRVLDLLDDAATLSDLPRLASYRLHKLTGNLEGKWSITSNLPWAVIFEIAEDEKFENVEIVNYHKG